MLFLHGILGTPRHFDFLLSLVPEDWSLWSLLLPGHGGSTADFGRSSMQEWKSAVEKALTELCESHDRVFIAGHSMGTLLAVHAAMLYPEKVVGIFALAMPLRPKFSPAAMLTSFRTAFLPPSTDSDREKAARASCSVKLSKNPLAYLGWVPRYLELFALAGDIRERLLAYALPIKALQSVEDELVSRRSERHLDGRPNIELHILPSSRHYLYSPEDKEAIKAEFKSFIMT